MNEEIRREIIMENYLHPNNRKIPNDSDYIKINTANSSCIDNLDIYIKIKNGIIIDITFDGEACAISTSATSIMIENLIGKTKEEALHYIHEFYKMTNGEEYNEEIIKTGIVYQDIYKQGNRKGCATLPFRGLEKIILETKE